MTISIFSSLTLPNGAVIPNRMAKTATQEHMADSNQNPSPQLIQMYKTWSEGGVGLSITGEVMVDRRAMGGPGDVVLEDDSSLDIFKKWAKAGSVGGNQFWLQVNHPGRQVLAALHQTPLAPSVVPMVEGNTKLFAPPKEITKAQIQEVIQRFKATSVLAERAGFHGVQIHGAHGYLISQFLSPYTNKRTDKWGGSLENRARLLFEVVNAIREAVSPAFCLGVKLNSADFQRGGFDKDDAKWVVEQLNDMKVDLVELSGGSMESPAMFGEGELVPSSGPQTPSQRTFAREAYFLTFAKDIAQVATIPVMVTGGISRRQILDEVIASGVDMAGMATALILNPSLPNALKNNEDPHPKLPVIAWKNRKLSLLARVSFINHQLRSLANGGEVDLNKWPSLALIKDIWIMFFRSRQYVKDMQRYTYKGDVVVAQ